MRIYAGLLLATTCLLAPAAALAGDEVLYGETPDWVSEATLTAAGIEDGPPELLADWQHRIEHGVVYSYSDRAVRIDNPQALMQENTLNLSWLPDKGDLTIHRLEILRDGEVIDLAEGGADFDVIRREQGLEMQLLDGELTATLPIPGLHVGDVLRVAYTVSTDDQALGEETQVTQYIPSKPWLVGMGRTIVSWPAGEEIFWRAEEHVGLADPVLRDGYRYLTVEFPLEEGADMPLDAPSRYYRPDVLRVGSFSGWNELSRVMAPHYYSAARVEEGGAIAREAAEIMEATADPLERTAMAVRLVQDEISYLLDGLDGGNYLPQTAEETWQQRYGDCKAKSVLLLALLQEMGIEAEPVLVVSQGGDALPQLLPLPADFDHVIVHARIGGADYWLDGTSAGTRLGNIADVPPFYHALPLRPGGADLMPMTQREKAQPNMVMSGEVDHSAGVDFPLLFKVDVRVFGPQSLPIRALVDQNNPDMLRKMASTFNGAGMEGGLISSIDVSYDEAAGAGLISIEGVANSEFVWEDGKLTVGVDQSLSEFDFNPDRARPEWRNIPVATQGPFRTKVEAAMLLPEGGKGFAFAGPTEIDGAYGNTRIVSSSSLSNGTVRSTGEAILTLGEIAAADLPEAKRAARRLESATAELVAPADVTWRWELDDAARREKARPIVAAYDAARDYAEDDDYRPLTSKARFLASIYDYQAALGAYDTLVDEAPSVATLWERASVYESLGRRPDAIADLQSAYDLEPSNGTAFYLAKLLAYDGRADEAFALLDSLPVGEADRISYADARAMVSGLDGDTGSALALLAEEVERKPENSQVLNADCWFRGLFNVALESALGQCTRAVERADNAVAALDSRAMVRYRLGDYDAAIADLDAALALAPGLAPSRYLRGIVRLRNGDPAGREDVETALRMAPELADVYGRHGVKPIS